MKFLLAAVAAAAMLIGVGTAQAQNQNNSGPLNGVYVGANLGSNFQNNSSVSMGLTVGHQFHKNLAAELTYDHVRYRARAGHDDGQMIMGNLVAGHKMGAFTPYALAGVGVGWNAAGQKGPGTTTALYNVGAGMRVSITSNVDLDARYRYVGPFEGDRKNNSHMITAGAVYRF